MTPNRDPSLLPCVVHIGLPKTGTKTLQFHLFQRHEQIHNIGVPYANEVLRAMSRAIAFDDRLEYDADKYRGELQKEIRKFRSGHKAVVFSEELLMLPACDRLTVAERLHDLFGDVRILICLRNQIDWIVSFYFGTRTETRFVYKWLPGSFEKWFDLSFRQNLHKLKYDETYDVYCNLFGKDNVSIVLFEDLKRDQEAFMNATCSFLGIDQNLKAATSVEARENARVSSQYLAYWRFRKRFLPNVSLRAMVPEPLYRLFYGYLVGRRETVEFSDETRNFLSDYYRDGNRRLEAKLGIPLGANGYPT